MKKKYIEKILNRRYSKKDLKRIAETLNIVASNIDETKSIPGCMDHCSSFISRNHWVGFHGKKEKYMVFHNSKSTSVTILKADRRKG